LVSDHILDKNFVYEVARCQKYLTRDSSDLTFQVVLMSRDDVGIV